MALDNARLPYLFFNDLKDLRKMCVKMPNHRIFVTDGQLNDWDPDVFETHQDVYDLTAVGVKQWIFVHTRRPGHSFRAHLEDDVVKTLLDFLRRNVASWTEGEKNAKFLAMGEVNGTQFSLNKKQCKKGAFSCVSIAFA